MKQELGREVRVGGRSYGLQLPFCYPDAQILRDPILTADQGLAQPPTSISLHLREGRSEITYRWRLGDTWVSLITAAYGVTGRHPYKPEFVISSSADGGGASPATDSSVQVATRITKRLPRAPVWRQDTSGLEADITRTAELHAKVRGWLAALPLGKV